MNNVFTLQSVSIPTLLPITVTEAKEYLRVVHTAHDSLINDLILTAVDQLREDTNYVPTLTSFAYSIDNMDFSHNQIWDSDILIYINNANSSDGLTFTYVDEDGVSHELVDGTDYEVDWCYPIRVKMLNPIESLGKGYKKIKLSFTAGHKSVDTIPAVVKQCIRYLVAHFYDNPSPVVTGTISSNVGSTYDRLIGLPLFKRTRV